MNTSERAARIDPLIPRPPADIVQLSDAFSGMVARHWEKYLSHAIGNCSWICTMTIRTLA